MARNTDPVEDQIPELTEELDFEARQKQEEERNEMLDKLGQSLAATRSDAINGREQSGIENEWLEDEEHYEGVDDSNRGELAAWRSKPVGQAALRSEGDTGSTVFFNITGPYCDAAAAKLGDMLLPTDDRGWSIAPTPIADLVGIANGKIPSRVQNQIQEAYPNQPEKVEETVSKLVDQVKQENAEARERAEMAQTRIDDWHKETQYQAENRLVIEYSSKLGTGILKGPVPVKQRSVAFKNNELIVQEEVKPGSISLNPWNFFPDPGCGENIHDGSYTWERDDITIRKLQELRGIDGYIDSQINKVLDEGPFRAVREFKEGDGRSDQLGLVERQSKNLFEIWYYYGIVDKDDMMAAGCECQDEQDSIFAQLTMVNNRVIKAAINPMDSGDFPYDLMVWKRRAGSPWGIGVARQLRTPQRIINGATRNMMDNAGLAGGAMWVFMQGLIEPIDGVYEIAPRKGWTASDDASIDDVRKAFSYVDMPMMQAELQNIIMLGLKMAEDVTGLPMLLQGQQGAAPDTVGGMQILNNNASSVMRRIVRLFDDLVTSPHVRRYYAWLLQYGDDAEKGDFMIEARGSSALIERDIQNQQITSMASIVRDPIFGLDPRKWIKEYLKSQRFDPKQFEYDDEKWQEIVEQLSAPPETQDSSMAIAELRAQMEQAKIESSSQIEQAKIQSNERIKAAQLEFDKQNEEKDRQVEMILKQADQELEAMKIEGNKDIGLDKAKVILADTAMKLKMQLRLSQNGTTPEVATPAVEPAGHAPDGTAFQN